MPACKKQLDDPTPTTLTEREALTVHCSDQRGVLPKVIRVAGDDMLSIYIFDMPARKKPLDDTTLTEREALTVRCSDRRGVMPEAGALPGVKIRWQKNVQP